LRKRGEGFCRNVANGVAMMEGGLLIAEDNTLLEKKTKTPGRKGA